MELIPVALSSESDDPSSLDEDNSSERMARGTNSSSESSVSVPKMVWKNAARFRTLSDIGSSSSPTKAANPESSDTRKGRLTIGTGLEEPSFPSKGDAGALGKEVALSPDVVRDAMYSSWLSSSNGRSLDAGRASGSRAASFPAARAAMNVAFLRA
jgi:hypothetical protein